MFVSINIASSCGTIIPYYKAGRFPCSIKGEIMDTTLINSHTQNVQKQQLKRRPEKAKYQRVIIAVLAALVLCFIIFRAFTSGSQTAVFYCVDDAVILYENNIDEPVAPASLTKLLTAAVALKYISPDEVFTVGTEQRLVPKDSSVSFILEGHRLRLYDLITGMLLVSGNDAAYTVAVSTARIVSEAPSITDEEAVAYFCELMNSFAAEIGMKNSHFTTPDGSDAPDQYTSTRDLLKLAEYALSVKEISEIVCIQQKYVVFESGENITWTNSNKLLNSESGFYCADAIGMKTGTTPKAGSCLVAIFHSNGKTYISVVMGRFMDFERYKVTMDLFNEYVY